MKKETKRIIGIVIAILLVLAIIWVVYESVKPEPASINPVNELPNENMGLDNMINDLFENVVTNTTSENEIQNEVVNETSNEEETVEQENELENENNENDSEVISGTTTSREDRAIELAKEYYQEEYGSIEEIYFTCQEINADGRYIVRAGNADSGTNMFLFVNVTTGVVSES